MDTVNNDTVQHTDLKNKNAKPKMKGPFVVTDSFKRVFGKSKIKGSRDAEILKGATTEETQADMDKNQADKVKNQADKVKKQADKDKKQADKVKKAAAKKAVNKYEKMIEKLSGQVSLIENKRKDNAYYILTKRVEIPLSKVRLHGKPSPPTRKQVQII